MTYEEKRQMATSIDGIINEVQRLNHNHFDMVNQLLSVNHEIYRKVEEIAHLRSKKNQLKSELKVEKEFIERLNKLKEAMQFLNEYMNAPMRPHDTSELGYVEFVSGVEQGESSKKG